MRSDDENGLDLDDADHALLGKLRALPGEGQEPDWDQLERSIHAAVGPDVPRPWWRRWQWLVPTSALAACAAAALLWVSRGSEQALPDVPTAPIASAPHVEHPVPLQGEPVAAAPATAIWLDGRIIEVDGVDPSAILDDDDDEAARAALATDDAVTPSSGMMPAGNLDWVDGLDDKALDRAEQWLDAGTQDPQPTRNRQDLHNLQNLQQKKG